MPELNMFTICSDIKPDESGVTRIITRGLEDILPMDQSQSPARPPDESEWINEPYLNMVSDDMRGRLPNTQSLCSYVSPLYIDASEKPSCRTLTEEGSAGAVPAVPSLGLLSTSPVSFTLSPHSGPVPSAVEAYAELTSNVGVEQQALTGAPAAGFLQAFDSTALAEPRDSSVDRFYSQTSSSDPTCRHSSSPVEDPMSGGGSAVSLTGDGVEMTATVSDSHKALETIVIVLERLASGTSGVTVGNQMVQPATASSSSSCPMQPPVGEAQEVSSVTFARIANLLTFIMNRSMPATSPGVSANSSPDRSVGPVSGAPVHQELSPAHTAAGQPELTSLAAPMPGLVGYPTPGSATSSDIETAPSDGLFAAAPTLAGVELMPNPLDTLAELALRHVGGDSHTSRLVSPGGDERVTSVQSVPLGGVSQLAGSGLATVQGACRAKSESSLPALVQTLADIILRLSEEPAVAAALHAHRQHRRQHSSLSVPVTPASPGLPKAHRPLDSDSAVLPGQAARESATSMPAAPNNLVSLLSRRSRSRSTPYQINRFILPEVGQYAIPNVQPLSEQYVRDKNLEAGVELQPRSSPLLVQLSSSAPEHPSVLCALPTAAGPSLVAPPLVDSSELLSSSSSAGGGASTVSQLGAIGSAVHPESGNRQYSQLASLSSHAGPRSSNASGASQHAHTRSEVKKCRKVYGVEHRDQWCNQCRWKKACRRFRDSASSMASTVATTVVVAPAQVQQNRSTSTQSSSTPELVGLDSPTDEVQMPSPYSGTAMSTSN